MRLITFTSAESAAPRVGALVDGGDAAVDLSAAGVADTLEDLIAGGQESLAAARDAIDSGASRRPASDITLHAPLSHPPKNVMCVGKNYHAHAQEFHSSGFDASSGKDAAALPEHPVVFTKAHTSIVGPGVPIDTGLDPTRSTDYEGELAVVIGRGGRGIRQADCWSHVFGYTIVNDVTARITQQTHRQWFLGKSIDTFCPMGPTLVTAEEVPDVRELTLTTTVNGEPRQQARVADLVFDIPTLIEVISRSIRLEPGDIIATGTPAGVGIGFQPPRYLRPGDSVAITIEPIGTLENPVT
ncbi:fumarylacetoacetate hydrolase family protein [Spiribacter halobius]|uniref:Hydrolase n=1 Tax=Sediminicurvatus halobius TaxID=2182432 RepID=A0A2U2N9N6_9GAMM|nr:fumarylacetoacetate hydrolase family protein [Spiribacter halobius]PWG65802.1 hydrolase [Spiribacter halobius]UEX77844.1 fumarylacetoacetate hydrolase family protein [Spiribacter halobius]